MPNKLFLATKCIDSEIGEDTQEHYHDLVQEHRLQNLQDVIKVNAVDSGPKAPISSEVLTGDTLILLPD